MVRKVQTGSAEGSTTSNDVHTLIWKVLSAFALK